MHLEDGTLAGNFVILPMEGVWSSAETEAIWQNIGMKNRALCGAVDTKELSKSLTQLWRRLQKDLAMSEYGAAVYQISPDQGWRNDVLLIHASGAILLDDGRVDLRDGYCKVHGKADALMSAAYTASRREPDEYAVLQLLSALSFAAMQTAVRAQPVRIPVYGTVRDRSGVVRLA